MRGIRLLVLSVIWIGSFFLILDRVNISLAAPRIMDDLKFNGAQMGFILSIYYWGYLLGHFGSGLVSDQIRLRRFTSWMILVWSALTALTGACSTLWQFSLVRLFFGISEGATANLTHKLQNNWLLPVERGRAYGIFIGFAYLGVAFGMPLVGWIINLYDWRLMFVIVGAMTLGLLALFAVIIRDHPHEHSWLADEEKARFREAFGRERTAADQHDGAPTVLTFRQRMSLLIHIRAFWLMCIAAFFGIGVYFTSMSWLPGYLVKERGFSVLNSGFYLTLPYLAAFAGMFIGGGIGDRFGHRSVIALVAGLLTFPALLGLTQTHGVTLTIVMMSVTLFLNSASLNGVIVLVFDIIPAAAFGTAIGIIGGLCGGLGGVLGPLLLGYLYDQTGSFFWGFIALGLGATLGALALIPVITYEKQIRQEKAKQQTLVSPAQLAAGEAASS